MNLGPLNRRGVLYANVPTVGEGAAPVDNWVARRNLYLTCLTEENSSAQIVADRVTENGDSHWFSRWFDGLTTDMRIAFEGRNYRIKRLRPVGRREGWEIWAEDVR